MNHAAAEQILAMLKEDSARDEAFFVLNEKTDHNEEVRNAIAYMLAREPDDSWIQQLACKPMSQARMVEAFEKSLSEDLLQKIAPQDKPLFQSCLLGVLPLHGINGHAQCRDYFGNTLDRPLLLINYGVYFISTYLAYALTFEILQNDLADFKRSGADFFLLAQSFYRNKNAPADLLARTSFESLPRDVTNEIGWHAGRLSSVMLWFVALHEFAHVRHGDIGASFWKSMCPAGLDYSGCNSKELLFRQEEAADRYAVESLGAWRDKSSNAWSNFAQAYLLMKFLEVMEEQQPASNITHPPARRRKELMYKHAVESASHLPSDDYMAFVEYLVDKWIRETQER